MKTITIQPTFDAWRDAARTLLNDQTVPDQVIWHDARGGERGLPFEPGSSSGAGAGHVAPRVPRAFVESCRLVACHRDPGRWALMYRVLWRLTHGEPDLLHVLVDDDVNRMNLMHKAVERDRLKMTAFVRFRRVVQEDGREHFIAWHRPDHYIVRLTAPFFVDRFGSMRWSILTPDESVGWDGHQLCFGVGVPARGAPQPDELESLWRTYYANIFNPARVNLAAMRREMPLKHWPALPETRDVEQMLRDAPARVEAMMKRTSTATTTKTSSNRAAANADCPSTGSAADFLPPRLTLPQCREAVQACRGCELYCNATQAVFGEGPKDALVMFVGEQPGDQEDRAGKPFVGPSGQMLNDMMAKAGIPRDQVYVTNAVKHFKFEQRGKRRMHSTPSAREVAACKPWLEAEIKLVRPRMIVCLGATAAKSLLGAAYRLTQHRHQLIENPWAPWLLATNHPSALLRIPDDAAREQAKVDFLKDMKIIAKQLEKEGLLRTTARERRAMADEADHRAAAHHPAP